MIEPVPSRLKTEPPAPIPWGVSDRDRQSLAGQRPARPKDPKRPPPTSTVIEGMGCEPSEACLDGEAPLRRDPSEP